MCRCVVYYFMCTHTHITHKNIGKTWKALNHRQQLEAKRDWNRYMQHITDTDIIKYEQCVMCIGAHMKPCTEMKTNVNYKESVDKCQQNDIICFKAFLNKPMDDMSTSSRNRDVKKRASESIMYQKFWVMTAFKSTKWKRRSKWKCKKKQENV